MTSPGPIKRPWNAERILRGTWKYGFTALLDAVAVFATYVLAVGVRTGARELDIPDPAATLSVAAAAGVLQVVANIAFDVYWRDWSIAAFEDLLALVRASALVAIVLLGYNLAAASHAIPNGAVVIGAGLVVLVEGALKLRARWPQIVRAAIGRRRDGEGVIVVGAGRTGQLLARALADGILGHHIVCFVDDFAARWGTYVRGIRVSGGVDHLPELVRKYGASTVIIAQSDPPAALVRRVADACKDLDVRIRAVGGFSLQRGDTSPLRPIGVEELLARDPVEMELPAADEYVRHKVVLVTGAAGSIGSELSRQLALKGPAVLLLADLNESGLHDVQLDIQTAVPTQLLLGDVRDVSWLESLHKRFGPEIVFHAAAYKHVPMIEESPLAGISSNVIGTARVLDAALRNGVDRFVFISSDKAVEPINVLGLTKRFGEIVTIACARERLKNYSVVRFGNVLGSSGSVIPLFGRQIDSGGPVTVTQAEATRYFMTIQEAAGLVIVAGALAGSGDLFVLDMGSPVSIAELARNMIRLRGLRTPTDIEITYTGLRPGEKLHESLFFPHETGTGTDHPRVMRVVDQTTLPSPARLWEAVRRLETAVADQDVSAATAVLREIVLPAGRAPVVSG